ncbi:hypothetical protein P8C59_005247 [Phyllachora maydis]|uniref:Retrovirus-related Pol polyprotein from transposon TNT 1-94-like beta-barrel domain-containing protein n=1 Tax=Phyllachora maydis TaxID=1825666 RepID=A0AAD9I424_9PEZI|nr:hypothetical protein P8C59_005247 [Phyllachora maydis]
MADQAKGKASVQDSVSAIKNISSTLASLTNSSNAVAATTGKTSYSPRFDPFSGTIDLDSPLCPPRKEPYLGPAVNSATSNLDPPIDTGFKEGFKDTITSSIVKELAKKAYTIPDDKAYRAAHVANSSNSTPNSNSNFSKKGKNKKKGKKKASYNVKGQNYSAKSAEQAFFILGSYNLAIEEEEESDSSSTSRYKKCKDFKGKGLKTSSNNKAKYKDNQPRRRLRDPALYNSWLYDTGSIDYISNSKERFTTFTPNIGQLSPINTGNGPISPASIGSIILEVLSRKAPPTYTKLVLDNVLYLPNIDINIVSRVRHYDSGGCLIKETLYGGNRRCIAVLGFKKSGFFLDVKGSSKPILHANFAFPLGLTSYNTTKSIEPQRNKILLELGVFKFLPRSLLLSNRKLITCQNILKVKKEAKNRPIKYKSRLVARGFIQGYKAKYYHSPTLCYNYGQEKKKYTNKAAYTKAQYCWNCHSNYYARAEEYPKRKKYKA